MSVEEDIGAFREAYGKLRDEIGRVIVGHEAIVEGTLIALFAGGHSCWKACPDWARPAGPHLGEALDLPFNRIQFTPDLMPADILGTNIVMETATGRREFEFQKGPIFAHLVLADEINRARQNPVGLAGSHAGKTGDRRRPIRRLGEPFFVMATQNPIDQEGTYPLPEAQLDRFFFKLIVGYPRPAN